MVDRNKDALLESLKGLESTQTNKSFKEKKPDFSPYRDAI